jgi:GTP-binding protein
LCVLIDLTSPEALPDEQERVLLNELAQYRADLLERPRLVVGTKADAVQRDELETMGWDRPVVSAVTGQGVRELVGRMAALVHEARDTAPRMEGLVVIRPEPTGATVERVDEHAFRLVGREVERVVALNDVTTPDALGFIDYRLEQLGVHKMLARAGAQEGDVVWIGEFSFDYQPGL